MNKIRPLENLSADLLNAVYSSPDGAIISERKTLEVYGISRSSYYRFISFLKLLDFLEIIWIDANYRKIMLKEKISK